MKRIANGIGYNESAVVSMLQFFSRTFLEQNGAEPRLRFREPSYNSITQSHVTDFPEEEEMIQSSSGKQTQIPVREYGKAGSNTFVNITEGSSETPTDTPSQPVRIIDKTGSSTPVSQASAKCGAVTDNAGAPAKPNVVSIVVCHILAHLPEALLLNSYSFLTFILFPKTALHSSGFFGAKKVTKILRAKRDERLTSNKFF